MTESMTAAEFLAFRGQGDRPKNPDRVIRGHAANKRGDDFEKMLDAAHAAYTYTGLASMDRLPVPTNPMPRSYLRDPRHAGLARILAKRQGFDYYGSLGPAFLGGRWLGRAVAMEAKATGDAKPSLPIRESGGIRPHQMEALVLKFRKFGTLSAVVWKNGEALGVLPGPAIVVAWQKHTIDHRNSIPWREFTPFEMREIDAGGPVVDWLGPVLDEAFTRETAAL